MTGESNLIIKDVTVNCKEGTLFIYNAVEEAIRTNWNSLLYPDGKTVFANLILDGCLFQLKTAGEIILAYLDDYDLVVTEKDTDKVISMVKNHEVIHYDIEKSNVFIIECSEFTVNKPLSLNEEEMKKEVVYLLQRTSASIFVSTPMSLQSFENAFLRYVMILMETRQVTLVISEEKGRMVS